MACRLRTSLYFQEESQAKNTGMMAVSRPIRNEMPVSDDEEDVAQHVRQTTIIASDFNQTVRPYIDLIDRLRRMGLERDIALPSIVVVGDQSSGKSSVLEALSGIQLPRGSGIVTRCPLELRLKCQTDLDSETDWRARITYTPQGQDFENSDDDDDFIVDEEFVDRNDVERRVRQAQNLLAGLDKGISAARIRLEITSRDVPDLTLIDLPGIVRVAVEGQRRDAGDVIRKLINDYIEKPETIILAVVPANVDIATSEALQMAKRVDPDGKRTLGVVTKPDLVDKGTEHEMISIITNDRYYLRRGYTLVRCRGQLAIQSKQALADALREEERYFDNPIFSDVKPFLGMRILSKKLTNVLVEHIRSHLPSLKNAVREKIDKVHCEMGKLGEGLPTDETDLLMFLPRVLERFSEMLGKVAEGEMQYSETNLIDLNPYKKAREVFEQFASKVDKLIPKKNDQEFQKRLKECIGQKRGRELPRFINFKACASIIRGMVSKFEQPAQECAVEVTDLVGQLYGAVAHQSLGQYHDLEMRIKEQIYDHQQDAKTKCITDITQLFKMEKLVYSQDRSYSATYDAVIEVRIQEQQRGNPKFPKTPPAVRNLVQLNEPYDEDIHIDEEAESMFEMVMAYMNICHRRVTDIVPMMILYHAVQELADKLRSTIWTVMATERDAACLLAEDPEIALRRDTLRKKLERLQKASSELRKF